jgi:2,4-dienoyl-CoA reductase-like NADH-dependent reductase (Old Yellow Enzyme family)
MLTGGITRRGTAEQVLASGVALVGMASAIAITPDPTGRTHPFHALVCDQRAQRRALGRYREWLAARADVPRG